MFANSSDMSLPNETANNGIIIARGLKEKSPNYKKLLALVLQWTGGQPFLTQKLCKIIIDSPESPPVGKEADWIESLVKSQIISNWERRPDFREIRSMGDRLCQNQQRSLQLLRLYQQVLQNKDVTSNSSPEQRELELLGFVARQQGKLKVHNRIYEAIFNQEWVEGAIARVQSHLEPNDSEFLSTLAELERRLLVSQVDLLSQADPEDQSSAQSVYEVLRDVTSRIGKLLSADRTTIYLLNEEKTDLWSLVAQNEAGEFLDIQVRVGEGIAGQVALTKKVINIPDNVYSDPRSAKVKESDKKFGYRTENILAFPILDDNKEVVAVIQLLNKMQPGDDGRMTIKPRGFTRLDLERLAKCVVPIRRVLESLQSCYKATKKLRATAALAEATRSLDQINLDTKAILQRVMNTAKKLMNADRSTLWLYDRDRGDLWTELPGRGEVRCPVGVGFAGQVAESREPMIIPFDLYDHPAADNAKKVDEQTHYRTCSLLCMPILSPEGELLGVTQLVNKRKPGDHPEYNKEDWPNVPDYFLASFDKNDRQSMQVFNERVGVILQFVKTHETLKQLAQIEPREAVHKSLAVLSTALMSKGDDALYTTLHNVITFFSNSVKQLFGADKTHVFILSEADRELWSLFLEPGKDVPTEVRVSINQGIASTVMLSKSVKATNKPRSFNDPLIQSGIDQAGGYLVHSLMLFPILNQQGQVVGIIRMLNKLSPLASDDMPLSDRVDPEGFSQEDADRLKERSNSFLPILQAFQSFHREIRTIEEQRQAIDPLYQAISVVSQSSGNQQEMLQKIMQAAKKLTNADRSTLWLIDHESNQLWTQIPQADNSLMEARVPIGEGFVGMVAKTGQTLNIPFDLYNHPSSYMARKIDQESRYRTCSLLCMPVLSADGEILGVTQLVNKRKPGDYPEYDPSYWPDVPDFFKTSFEEKDQKDMEIFNNQVGVVLPNVMLR
jgi:GAF domain-containing protein